MKKISGIFVVLMLLLCSACSTNNPDDWDVPESTVTLIPTETDAAENDLLPLPQDSTEFSFLSGAGGWRTILTLNRDGTFVGWYLDSEMGEIGEGYPNGSAYTCTFSGKFENIERINEFSYKMTLADIKTEKAVGEAWIEDEIRYVASGPFGLNDPVGNQECTDYIFCLPDTPTDQVPEEFLSWWPYRYTQDTDPKTTLSCYGILNVTTNYGFFHAE